MVEEPGSLADNIFEAEPMVEILVPPGSDVTVLQNINKTLRGFPGKVPVSLLLHSGGELRRMNLPFSIDPDPSLEEKVREILGEGAFKLV